VKRVSNSSISDRCQKKQALVSLRSGGKATQTWKLMRSNVMLYVFLLPAVAYVILFSYIPMYGIQIAFKSFSASKGILGSPWVGLKWFEYFFSAPNFWGMMKNTLLISIYGLVAGFPIPILIALMLSYVNNMRFKRITQTISYIPHFISIVVMVGMISSFLSPGSGFINTLLSSLGIEPIYFMGEPSWFRHIYVWSGVWQGAGWGSIIYIAALSNVSPELHESAVIDGANIPQRMWHIDVPAIMPTMVILMILSCGSILNVGFEKVYLMQNALNTSVSEVISTYTYKVGLLMGEYSYSTAIGLFNTVINFIILVLVNRLSKKLSDASLW